MEIDRELDRMIEAQLEDWKERKHLAVFSYAGVGDAGPVGEFYLDGQPVRQGASGGSAWISLDDAKRIAVRLGVSLQIA